MMWIGRVACVAVCVTSIGTATAADKVRPFNDGFEAGVLTSWRWNRVQIEDWQTSFPEEGRCGKRALAITVTDGDPGPSCTEDEPCQRAEIRMKGRYWPPYATDVWFGFSFKVTGELGAPLSNRTVVGQWKAPVDDSPMLAQRMDRGVFHITVQDNDARRLVASSRGAGDIERLHEELRNLKSRTSSWREAVERYETIARVQDMAKSLGSAFDAGGLIDSTTELARAIEPAVSDERVKAAVDVFTKFQYLEDMARYGEPADLELEREGVPVLPDPTAGWVDMVYRIRAGRDDNPEGPTTPGEIDIWANGKKVASVRGNLGYTLKKAPPRRALKFKFGIYRDPIEGTAITLLDELRQGSSYEEVAVNCDR